MTFEELRLAEPLLRALSEEGYVNPTPIQSQAIPQVMSGQDLLGIAQTGTGKTAAFALPILHKILNSQPTSRPQETPAGDDQQARAFGAPRPGRYGRGGPGFRDRAPSRKIRALVLAPTRELAQQIYESFSTYGRHSRLRFAVVFGGVGQNPQVQALRTGVDVVIATPGRLLDLANQGHVNFDAIDTFVLDEADHMLDMGFVPDVRRIAALLPQGESRQTLMFSATMPPEIRSLANSLLRNPVKVEVTPVSSTVERIDQAVFFVDRRNKPTLMIHLLQNTSFTRTLVFSRTKHGADKIVRVLRMSNITAEAIHGNKSQGQRQRTLENFRSGKTAVLIASDIAARGIDIDAISHVFNYDLPEVPETYVHRIGRTGRAGSTGSAISFCDYDERGLLRAIERTTGAKIAVRNDHPNYADPIRLPRVEDIPGHPSYQPNAPRTQGRPFRGFDNARRDGAPAPSDRPRTGNTGKPLAPHKSGATPRLGNSSGGSVPMAGGRPEGFKHRAAQPQGQAHAGNGAAHGNGPSHSHNHGNGQQHAGQGHRSQGQGHAPRANGSAPRADGGHRGQGGQGGYSHDGGGYQQNRAPRREAKAGFSFRSNKPR